VELYFDSPICLCNMVPKYLSTVKLESSHRYWKTLNCTCFEILSEVVHFEIQLYKLRNRVYSASRWKDEGEVKTPHICVTFIQVFTFPFCAYVYYPVPFFVAVFLRCHFLAALEAS
jgi:hypothetical protein